MIGKSFANWHNFRTFDPNQNANSLRFPAIPNCNHIDHFSKESKIP